LLPPVNGRDRLQNLELPGEIIAPILCSAALLLCLAIANPFVNSAFNDDWSFSHVALKLAATGHFQYNGWGAPTIVFQSAWAAMFIRFFGFSFNILRAVTLPFSVGFVCLTYFLSRSVGLRRKFAAFAALAVAVSPLFLPLSASFMTESYACFFTLLCLYAAIRSGQSGSRPSALIWLWILAISGTCGGSDRQTVWIAPLLLMPYLCFLNRSSKRFLLHAGLAYATCLAALAVVTFNFGQRYAATELSKTEWLSTIYLNGTTAAHYIMSILLVSALMCLPAFLCLQPLWTRLSARACSMILLVCAVAFDYLRSGLGPDLGVAPFLGNILTRFGVLYPHTAAWEAAPSYCIYTNVTQLRFFSFSLLPFGAACWQTAKFEGACRLRQRQCS
jgi:Dolichyl-phosphate-mannose-protein mannosyltransferase